MKQKNHKNEKGFTMIELIIVVAIMAIIGAVLVPMFNNMSMKARLTSDITTIKTFQRQLDVYKAETGDYPANFASTSPVPVTEAMITKLVDSKYLDPKDLLPGVAANTYVLRLQTGAALRADDNRCYLNFDSTKAKDQEYIAIIKPNDDTDDIKVWAKSGDATITKTP